MGKIKVAIIGGGASGLFVASLLNNSTVDITIFEKNNKLGKKILASGNGKCNFTNIFENCNKYNDKFANKIIDKYTVDKTLTFFSQSGLVYKNDDQGRCYPISECAGSVLDCLKLNINKVKIKLECVVEDVFFNNEKCMVKYNGNVENFDYVVCCSGSLASNLGSDKAYSYLKNLDVKFKTPAGSLTPIIVKENVKSLFGVRIKCEVKLLDCNKNVIYKENGEVIFKENGLSGIAIFNASGYICRNPNERYFISLDLSNGMDYKVLEEYFKNKRKDNLFKGFLNDKIGEYISLKTGKFDNLKAVIENITNLKFEVIGLYPLKDSQVCSGGVLIEEVDDNLRLKKYPCIYVAGELLNVDGLCGGYNLQFAWSSGGVIANDLKERIK